MIDLNAIEARTQGLEQEQRDDILALIRIAYAAHLVAQCDWSTFNSFKGARMQSLRNAMRNA